ncbi:hypothetical protein G6M04_14665 [Agrobacterium rhizogenes]|uniref:hypothetical protein n=1 Tax=Rhizobium rhizogenes TaxID=359 RepID=UPI001573A1CA|nr:hypothetical protein [Rhizobium rhizogenes]NTG48633.1 hypothetical protein [Rhizobium rhizogenes]
MSEIVERLKDMSEFRHMDRSQDAMDDIMREAADEITRLRSERDAAKAMCDEMAKVLEDISFGRGTCASCGKLADMPRNWVGCDENNGHNCRWAGRDPAPVAIAALAAYRKAQEVGNA